MRLDRAVGIGDLQRLAKKRLPRMVYDYMEGGCDDEEAIAENGAAFRAYKLLPRYLVDVSQKDLTASIAGQTFSVPLGIAPTGNAEMFRHDADRLLAAEAAAANVPFILSGASNASIEEVMKVAPDHTWFQLYATKDPEVTEDMVRRARDLAVKVLVLSVDVPAHSNRERNRRSGFMHPLKVTPSMVFQALTHPRWSFDYFSHGGLPYMGNFRPYAPKNASPSEVADLFVDMFPAPALTWSILERLRQLWPQKLFVKGILHPSDALRAIDAGADGIIVSNHGGRQLDAAPTALHVFPSIRAAVSDKVDLMLDGGIRRGSDIVVACCLGAKFVFLGRPTLYGVAAGGRSGIKIALETLVYEFGVVLAQIGCPRTDDLGPHFLTPGQRQKGSLFNACLECAP